MSARLRAVCAAGVILISCLGCGCAPPVFPDPDPEPDAGAVGPDIIGECDALPNAFDLGPIAVGTSASAGTVILNAMREPLTVEVGEITSGTGAFALADGSVKGTVVIAPEQSAELVFVFTPQDEQTYAATLKVRMSPGCEYTLLLTGSGIRQPLSWDPAAVDCGYVTPGVQVTRDVTFHNASAQAIRLTDLKALNSTEFGVAATGLIVPAAVRDGEGHWAPGAAEVSAWCRPAQLGHRQTQLSFQTDFPGQLSGSITMKVTGGGPDIDVSPSPELSFGKVAYFAGQSPPAFQRRRLSVRNAGVVPEVADPDANLKLGAQLTITPQNANTAAGEFEVSLPPEYDPALGLVAQAGRNSIELVVKVTPSSAGLKEAELAIPSNDPDEPVVKVKLTADAVVLPPCSFTVTPSLGFGLLQPPEWRDLEVVFTNTGTQPDDVCLVSNVEVAPGSAGAFSLPGGPIDSAEVAPGGTLHVRVRAAPKGGTPVVFSTLNGQVELFVSSPVKPQVAVPLAAALGPSCLRIAPQPANFGTVKLGCASATRTLNLYNTCAAALTLKSIALSHPEFELLQTPVIPAGGLMLGQGAVVPVQVKYTPLDQGEDLAGLVVSGVQSAANAAWVGTLEGEGSATGIATQTFPLAPRPKVDVLIVVDPSCSIAVFLSNEIPSLSKYAISAQVDAQIGVTTTDPFGGALATGPTHPDRIIGVGTPNGYAQLQTKIQALVNTGTATEYVAEAALNALTPPLIAGTNAGLLREDAALSVLLMTDETDQSPLPMQFYLDGLRNVKGADRPEALSVSAIAAFSPACKAQMPYCDANGALAFYSSETGGAQMDACTSDWPKSVEALGKTLFGFRTDFPLRSVPDTANGTVSVKIDGTSIPQVDSRGATVWTYDPIANLVQFEPIYVPEPGQTMTITYPTACYP